MFKSKKLGLQILIALLIMLLAVPAAFAGEPAQLIFNGQEYGNVSVRDGVSYTSTTALTKIPGLEVEDMDKEVAIRSFFERQGGIVSWDGQKRQVIVFFNVKDVDDTDAELTADEIVIKYTERLEEVNSYKMTGNNLMKFDMVGFEADGAIPEFPEMEIAIEGVFQYEPMAMYMKQTMKLPFDEMGLELTPEELEELAAMGLGGDMVTEMVWLDNAIYQKNPMSDQWIVQDLSDLGVMEDLQNLMQITPQQSLEMMNKAGIANILGDDVEINGKEFYSIENFVDAEAFQNLLEEMLGEFDFAEMVSATAGQMGLEAEEMAEFDETFEQVLEVILNNLEIELYLDTLVNKETLFSEYMNMDLKIELDIKPIIEELAKTEDVDMTDIPEGPMNISITMTGDYQLSDFGTKLELPDLSNAISQEEFMKQLMEQMELEFADEFEVAPEPEAVEEIDATEDMENVEEAEEIEEDADAEEAETADEVEETKETDEANPVE